MRGLYWNDLWELGCEWRNGMNCLKFGPSMGLCLWCIYLLRIVATDSQSQWPHHLRRRSVAACLLRSWVRILPGAWMFVCCECCVLSCDELIICPEEFYRLWCVVVCDLETSRIGAPYIYVYDISSLRVNDLTLILLTWRKWWTPNNATKWQMGFNSAFKGLICSPSVVCWRMAAGLRTPECRS